MDQLSLGTKEKSIEVNLFSFDKDIYDKVISVDVVEKIREELKKSEEIFQNLGSAAILMDVNTGEIISMVSLPDFNPNHPVEDLQNQKYFNKNTLGIYEFGSVMKTFTTEQEKQKVRTERLIVLKQQLQTHY